MDCASAREVLSARLDKESRPEEDAAADAHIAGCRACRAWWTDAARVTRRLRVRPAEQIPDVASAVLARTQRVAWARYVWVRWCLAIVSITEIVMAAPELLFATTAAPTDEAPYIGSFGLAVAFGLLYVAWRPGRAVGILPIVAALAVTMAVTASVHLAVGRTSSLGEAHHLLELSGLVLVWVLAGRPLPRQLLPSRRHDPPVDVPSALRPT